MALLPEGLTAEQAMRIGLDDDQDDGGSSQRMDGDDSIKVSSLGASTRRGRSRSRSRGRRERSRSNSSVSSVDSFGRQKKHTDEGDGSEGRRRRRRGRSRSGSAERRQKEREAIEEASSKAAALRAAEEEERKRLLENRAATVGDPREVQKYVVVETTVTSGAAPPPPPPRRRRASAPGKKEAGAAATSTTTTAVKRQASDGGGGGEMHHLLETPEEREQREIAERRAKRQKVLQSYGGAATTTTTTTTTAPSPTLTTTVAYSSNTNRPGEEEEQPMQQSPPPAQQEANGNKKDEEVIGEKEAAGEEKEALLRTQLLLRFQVEARKRREDATAGGSGGGGRGEGGQKAEMVGDVEGEEEGQEEEEAGNFLDKQREAKEDGDGADHNGVKPSNGTAPPPPPSTTAAAPALDIFSDEGPEPAGLQEVTDDKHLVADNHNDEEGYFQHRVGERLNNRYKIVSSKGRGVFSSVLLATDEVNKTQVAIKVLRGIDIMSQAGKKELDILRTLTTKDPKGEKNCIRLLDDFRLGGGKHVCIVMEAMEHSLRRVLKTHGKGRGISYQAVLSFTRQLMHGLSFLHSQGLVHADLKPDNIVIDKHARILKICDFGSAFRADELEDLGDMPYLQSRFYRAPEVILGYKPRGRAIDLWSAAATMFEMYTDKVLFTGRHNNELLKNIMAVRGPFPKRLLKQASMRSQHFNAEMRFISRELGGQQQEYRRTITNIQASQSFADLLFPAKARQQASKEEAIGIDFLRDMLDQCLALDPSKRLTAQEACDMFNKASGGGATRR